MRDATQEELLWLLTDARFLGQHLAHLAKRHSGADYSAHLDIAQRYTVNALRERCNPVERAWLRSLLQALESQVEAPDTTDGLVRARAHACGKRLAEPCARPGDCINHPEPDATTCPTCGKPTSVCGHRDAWRMCESCGWNARAQEPPSTDGGS